MSNLNIELSTDSKEGKYLEHLCEPIWLDWYKNVIQAVDILNKHQSYNGKESERSKKFRILKFFLNELLEYPRYAKDLGCTMEFYIKHQNKEGKYNTIENTKGIPWIKTKMSNEEKIAVKIDNIQLLALWDKIIKAIKI